MMYNFSNDVSIKYQMDSMDNFYQKGVDNSYDLKDFKMELDEDGVDFYKIGKGTKITKKIASMVF